MAAPSDETGTRDEIDLVQIAGTIWRGKLTLLISALIVTVLAATYAFLLVDPRYAASTRLVLQARDQQVINVESVMSGVGTDKPAINTELAVFTSRGLLEKVVADLDLVSDPEFNTSLGKVSLLSLNGLRGLLFGSGSDNRATPSAELQETIAIQRLRSSIVVLSPRDTYLFDVTVTTSDPAKSARIANRLAQIYIQDQIDVKLGATEYAVEWLGDRVSEIAIDLAEKEKRVKDVSATSVLNSREALDSLRLRGNDMKSRMDDTTAQRDAAATELQTLTRLRDAGDWAQFAAVSGDAQLASAIASAAEEQALANRAARVVAERQAALNRATASVTALSEAYDQLTRQFDEQFDTLSSIEEAQRDVETTRLLYETFQSRLKEASIQIGLQSADSRVLSEAIPGYLVAPKKVRITAMGMLMGLLIGTAIIFVQQFVNTGFRSARELTQRTGMAVLGQLSLYPIQKSRAELMPYLRANQASIQVEAVRNLRTSLLISNIDNPPQVIMLTSSVPGESKTTTSISLAQSLGAMGKRVLLIEGDVRRRTLSQYFGREENRASIIEAIRSDDPVMLLQHRSHEPEFDIIIGEKIAVNAADLFSSQQFGHFLNSLRRHYDFILIDTPPVLIVPDARIIARQTDAVLFNVAWNSTSEAQVIESLTQLHSVSAPVVGLVITKIDLSAMQRYGYREYSGYSTYSKSSYDV